MNWDTVKGNWKQMTGKIKEEWGDLTDDEITEAEGDRDQLIGKIQAKYGIAKEEAEKQVDESVIVTNSRRSFPRGRLFSYLAYPMVCSASLISSRIAGSSIVAGSLNSAPSAIFTIVARRIFPDRVFGRRSTTKACLNAATGPI